jgi:hypothetical protein
MELTYRGKELVMQQLFFKYKSPDGFRSSYKAVPIDSYEKIKQFIDFTKYYVMFRGPRLKASDASTRKRMAHSFDVYQRSDRDTNRIRVEREAFQRGVNWANNRSH